MTSILNGKSNLPLNGKKIGTDYPVYLVAEAGATHTGIESAKRLVDIAIESGFDAVKFQMVNADKTDSKDELFGKYKRYDILKQRELETHEWLELKEYCKDIFMFYTVTHKYMVDKAETYKIASRWLKDLDLINLVSKMCKVIQIDTGGALSEEIEQAIQIIDLNNCGCIIHHCPSGYPSEPEKENLTMIKALKSYFKYPIAYSSHTKGIEMDLMALVMGADVIEKPIREVKSESISPENEYALIPEVAKVWVETIRRCEKAI